MISIEKRENATIWESKTTGCYEFQCHNDSGPIIWKQCNKTDEICEIDKCVVLKEETMYYVEIEVDGIDVTDVNISEIQTTISDLTGIEANKLEIRVDTNYNNEVIRIIVIVDDKETAEIISKSVNIAIDEHNQEGIVRYFKSARVIVKEKNLSLSCGIIKEERIIVISIIALLAFIIHKHQGKLKHLPSLIHTCLSETLKPPFNCLAINIFVCTCMLVSNHAEDTGDNVTEAGEGVVGC